MIDGFEYTIRLLNGSVVTVTQGVEPSIPPGSEVYVVCSEKGRSRVIPK
jgi:outer membrane lipoprotein SlyB